MPMARSRESRSSSSRTASASSSTEVGGFPGTELSGGSRGAGSHLPTTTQFADLLTRLEALEARLAAGPYPQQVQETEEALHFCSLPQIPERTFAADVSPYRESLIRYSSKKWVNGTKLRYYFFERGSYAGGNDQKELVRQGFEVWANLGIGISFEEINHIDEAEVRIGFLRGDGSWSYVGRDVVDIPDQGERTMNFGWDLTRDPRGVDTPVHEIGHTLGFPHEHQNPFAGIVWDEEAVYDYFGRPPNGWPRERTYYNILRKLAEGEVEGTEWDPNSIMHYEFPAGLILRPERYQNGLRPERGLSDRDIQEARFFYPPLDEQRYPELKPFHSHLLALDPGEQENFVIQPTATREYTIQTFGTSDTVMVLFVDQNGELKYVDGDDDSGTSLNAKLKVRLYRGQRYVLRLRLYFSSAAGETAVMMW
jgi:hypothetical protein